MTKEPAKKEARKQPREESPAFLTGGAKLLPLEYMLLVMNSDEVDAGRRDRMAVAAAAYVHPKIGEGGKKDQKQADAEKAAGGKFGLRAVK